jgi:hypothetical protein
MFLYLVGPRLRNAFGAGKETVEMVEAAILGIDDYDGFDLFQPCQR